MGLGFAGFDKEMCRFFGELEENNDREWFAAHREVFDRSVLEPARQYVTAMGERLRKKAPGIVAMPMVDKSIFRLHRDTRFSSDKRPFKTHLGIFLWEGDGSKLDCSGFYLHLEKDRLLIGGGIHIFSKALLAKYRAAVAEEKSGRRLVRILEAAGHHFHQDLDEDVYKRVPRGYPADHPRALLLKKKGMTLGESMPIPDALFTPEALDFVYDRFEKMLPLHKWLLEMIARDD
jgi:uncharacterized protein (TIGR02453 family)